MTMFKFLDLTCSTTGYVGRGVWWWTQLVALLLFYVLALGLLHTSGRITQLSSIGGAATDAHLQFLTGPARNRERVSLLAADWNIVYALAAALLFVFWAHLVIEVKRWHDLDFSGYCVWIRILPVLAHAYLGSVAGIIVSFAVAGTALYFLGFRPGLYDHYQDAAQPARSRFATLNDLGGAVGLILLVVAYFKFAPFTHRAEISGNSSDAMQSDSASDR